MALDEPDDNIGTSPPPALALVEHGVGLADARGRAEIDAEMTGRFDHIGGIGLHRSGCAHALAGSLRDGDPCLPGDLASLPSHGVLRRYSTRQGGLVFGFH